MRITQRLSMLRFPVGQAYLWRDGDQLTLIDTGAAGSGPAIAAAVAELGLGTAAITRIVLTHGHNDHAGGAAHVRAWHGAPVHAHRDDTPLVRGEAPPPVPVLTDWEQELYDRIVPGVPPAPPCPVDVVLHGGEVLDFGDGARVIPVPGHTPGSVALHLPAHGVLFTGDTIASHDGQVILGVFNADPAQAVASFTAQAELPGVEIACFGHGDPVVASAGAALRTAAATLAATGTH
ncbi:MBL fold metallo-hydrolase [Actinokineospora sp. 24-640]